MLEIPEEFNRNKVMNLLLWASTFSSRFKIERVGQNCILTFVPIERTIRFPEFLNKIETKMWEYPFSFHFFTLKGIECDRKDTKSLKVLKLYKKIEGRKK